MPDTNFSDMVPLRSTYTTNTACSTYTTNTSDNYTIINDYNGLFDDVSTAKLTESLYKALTNPNRDKVPEEEETKIYNLLTSSDVESVVLGIDLLGERRLSLSCRVLFTLKYACRKYVDYMKANQV